MRDRLRQLGVPFADVDLDLDTDAARLVESINHGHSITPTLTFGGPQDAVAEPSLDALDARLQDDGWTIHRPEPLVIGGDLVASPVPLLALTTPAGAAFQFAQFRDRHQLAVFFVHAGDCLVCAGYSRQLAAVRPKLADGDARALVVVPGGPADAARWTADHTDRVTIVADRNSRWKRAVAAHIQLDMDGGGAMLLALDRYLAARTGSSGPDAGSLITPGQAAEWLEFASFERADAPPAEWEEESHQ